MNVDGGNLNVAFDGRQLWRVDLKGLEWKNMRVDIASPNDIPDSRYGHRCLSCLLFIGKNYVPDLQIDNQTNGK